MGLYRARARTTLAPTAAMGVLGAFRPGIRPPDVVEMRLFLRNTPALSGSPTAGFAVGLCRSTALGTGGLTQVVGVSTKGSGGPEAGVGSLVTAWATAPPTVGTVTTVFDSAIGGTQIGYPVVFPFDYMHPLEQADSSDATAEIVLVLTEAHTTAPVFDVIAVWDE